MTDGPAPSSSPSPEAQARATLIRNERLKITASYANGLAIAAIGGVTPFFSLSVAPPPDPAHRAATLFGCVLVSAGRHVLAHQLLRMLR